jgi:hypothetical protein
MNLSDSCVGTITVEIDSSAVGRELSGSFDCTWAGSFEATASQFGDGKVEGGIDPNDFSLTGQGWYGPIELTWSGKLDSEEVASGSWKDKQAADASTGFPEFHHSGQFNLQKQ